MQIRNVKLQFCRTGAGRSSVHLTALDTGKNTAEITELCSDLQRCSSKNSPGVLGSERRREEIACFTPIKHTLVCTVVARWDQDKARVTKHARR